MRVSVIIATYNYGKYLGEALESVFAQDFPGNLVEVIVVDDGSTDDTAAVAARYSNRIKYLYQANQGQGAAFNTGFAQASGDIICLLDSDDAWKPEKLSKSTAAFGEADDIGMVQHLMLDVRPDGTPMPRQYAERSKFYSLEDFLRGRAGFTGTSGLAFRRSILDAVLPVPKSLFYCADEYLYSAILFHSRVRSLNEVLGYKKIHDANWFAGTVNDTRRLGNYIKVKAEILKEIEAKLAEKGLRLEDTSMELPRELAKSRALYYARVKDRKKALSVIRDEILHGRGVRRKLFTAASLALAVASPALYSGLYALYSKAYPLYLRLRRAKV